jgi:hypothetical protein
MKRLLSVCCLRDVEKGSKRDPYPLGRGEYNGYGISYVIDVCECCGKEAETVEKDVCEECGAVSDGECLECQAVEVSR